jgi:hypothetical protein
MEKENERVSNAVRQKGAEKRDDAGMFNNLDEKRRRDYGPVSHS